MATSTKPLPETGPGAELMAALATGIHSIYQPIVRLADRRVIAYEALARGPAGSPLELPEALFATARRESLETTLDWECWRAALRGGLQGGIGPERALFVNVEPSSATSWVPEIGDPLLEEALERFPLVVELTERALPNHTTDLIPLTEDLRRRGARIALDDVGTDPRSLALMPFLRPDVIKLDLGLLHDSPSRKIAEVVHAVNAEAERTGALILAEGIETEDHLRRALALGASYGQGWLFGRPGELRPDRQPLGASFPLRRDETAATPSPYRTPFEIVSARRPLRRADKDLLLELSLSIERQTSNQGAAAVVISSFQEASYFTPETAGRYARLAEDAALVAALGVGMDAEPAPGVRGVHLSSDEALRGEWNVTVLGPHFGAAFVARDLGDGGPDHARRFDFALTHDRELVTEVARSMMLRLSA
ncbi:MAG TPA: EAL domain-containing protein [Solirubrobacterales bacterium]|nr:EAL domain-containing protein [Solirubrobacterales bacterium]